MVLVNSQLLVCAMVEVSSSNAYPFICKIHTICYTMFWSWLYLFWKILLVHISP